MEGQPIPLTENGLISYGSDVLDGISASQITLLDDTGLIADGAALSRITIDVPDEPKEKKAVPTLFLAIEIGDVRGIAEILRQAPELVSQLRHRGFLPIHHACNARNVKALRELIKHGANVGAYDAFGNTALHLAVSEAWYEGIAELLSHGASANVRCKPPNTVREVRSETPFHTAVRMGDLTATTLLLEQSPDLQIKDGSHSTVCHLAAQARSLEIVRLLIKEKLCQDIMTSGDCHNNSVLHSALLRACDPESESNLIEIIKVLINTGADVDAVNLNGETPLYLAARLRLPKLVEFLLSVGADPTHVTCQGQTLVHAACYRGCATSLSHLLNTSLMNDFITQADNEGREPFHYAVQSSSIDCCELLLKNGDHLTREDKDGVLRFSLILKHLPSATQLLQRLFDANVLLTNKPEHNPDFRINFDYSVLLSPKDNDAQSSLISELTTSNLSPFLKHPLLESFLYFKWQRIKMYFYTSVFIYFLYLMLHTIFIVLTFGHFQMNWCDQKGSLWIFIVIHIFMFMLIIIPDLFIFLANFKKYLCHLETYTKLIALASSAFVLFSCTVPVEVYLDAGFQSVSYDETYSTTISNVSKDSLSPSGQILFIQNTTDNVTSIFLVRYAAATSAFFGWMEFMMLLGRFPSLGSYVLMFTSVAKSIIKFMLAFSSLLIGFALSFMVLFYKSPVFRNFPLSLIKTLMMMIGEIEYGDLHNELQLPTISLIFLVLFLFLVCIVMANLLIGLAVNDIPDLQRRGKIRRLAKQAAYLMAYEKIIAVAHKMKCFPSSLHIWMASRCKILKQESVYPNQDYNSHTFKNWLPSETIQEAILLGSCEDIKEDFTNMEKVDIEVLFKSFQVRYNRDRKVLNKKLAQLPDGASIDKILQEHLQHMQEKMTSQLAQLSFQIQQQMQQNQNDFNHSLHLQKGNYQVMSDTAPNTSNDIPHSL